MSYIGISICVLLCAVILKDKNRVFATVLSIAGAGIILFSVVKEFVAVIKSINLLGSYLSSTQGYIALMLKVLAITLLTQLVSDICRDNGENALADITETAAKVIVISLVLPLFETVINIVDGLIK